MAEILGFPDDAIHWNSTVGMDNIQHNLENQWELDTEGMYGSTKNGMGWTNIAPAGGMHMFFPRYINLSKKKRHVQRLAINKKSTFFVLSS